MNSMKIGLIGYGKAGKAVARVLANDSRFQLQWIIRREAKTLEHMEEFPTIPIYGIKTLELADFLDKNKIDAIVDFSDESSLYWYGNEIAKRQIIIVSAISNYSAEGLTLLQKLGEKTKVMYSPNITLGINFLMLAAKLLKKVAPFADIEIIEQHFKEKQDVSGTAKKIAHSLALNEDKITALRIGGIVGHHEVIFGFPHQTLRITHDSIRREAFGTGVAYAVSILQKVPIGFYTYEQLLQNIIADEFRNLNSN